MNNALNLPVIEQRLLAMQQTIGIAMAHLADQNLLDISRVQKNVKQVAAIEPLCKEAQDDIERLFGIAELTSQAFEHLRDSQQSNNQKSF